AIPAAPRADARTTRDSPGRTAPRRGGGRCDTLAPSGSADTAQTGPRAADARLTPDTCPCAPACARWAAPDGDAGRSPQGGTPGDATLGPRHSGLAAGPGGQRARQAPALGGRWGSP